MVNEGARAETKTSRVAVQALGQSETPVFSIVKTVNARRSAENSGQFLRR
jgi:hypothetical protein